MGVVEEEEVRSSYEVGLEGRAVLEDQEDQAALGRADPGQEGEARVVAHCRGEGEEGGYRVEEMLRMGWSEMGRSGRET